MKKVLILLVSILLLVSVSCDMNIKRMENGSSINENIFPYLEFKLDSAGTGFIAYVRDGASVESLSVPGEIQTEYGSMAVKEFGGYNNPDDALALKRITLDANISKIAPEVLSSAINIEKISYRNSDGKTWIALPELQKDGYHFLGWKAGDTFIKEGMTINPDYPVAEPVFEAHKWDSHEEKAASCTEAGWKSYRVCSVCGSSTFEEIDALGHDIIRIEKTDATCTSSGIREHYKCTRCDLVSSDSEGKDLVSDVVIPAKGHSLILVEAKEPTCLAEGNIKHYKCSGCGHFFNAEDSSTEITDPSIAPVDHRADESRWFENADRHWRKCLWCDYDKFENTLHEFDSGVFSEDGKKKVYTCKECGHKKTEEIKDHDHQGKEVVKTIDSTCEQKGYTLKICSICGMTYEADITPIKEHAGHSVEAKDPTCMEKGIKAHFHCTQCGGDFWCQSSTDRISAKDYEIATVGHEADSSKMEQDDNSHWYLCKYGCGAKVGTENHTYAEIESSEYKKNDRNCTHPDVYFKSCSKCGRQHDTATFEVGEPMGHHVTNHEDAKDPACTEDGNLEYWYCDRCKGYGADSSITEVKTLADFILPRLGHDYQWVNTNTEKHWKICERCKNEEPDSRKNHSFVTNGGITSCIDCSFSEVTSLGGISVKVENKVPQAHIEYTKSGISFKFSIVDEKPGYPVTSIKWYVNDVLRNENSASFSFDAPYPVTYKVMCIYSNDFGAGSETVVIDGAE